MAVECLLGSRRPQNGSSGRSGEEEQNAVSSSGGSGTDRKHPPAAAAPSSVLRLCSNARCPRSVPSSARRHKES